MELTSSYPRANLYKLRREHAIPLGHAAIAIDGQAVSLVWIPEHLGGIRPYFLCPQCHTRRHDLYNREGQWACRACHNLVYRSQIEEPNVRLARRARKVREKLGNTGKKPRGMHKKAFERLTAEDRAAFLKGAKALGY